jgi:hypothetical protein
MTEAVQVEDNTVGWPVFVNAIDPGAGQVSERRQVRLGRKPLGLEAAHLAG